MPHEVTEWIASARSLERAGNLELALATYKRALTVRPKDDEICCRVAGILFRLGSVDEAIATYASVDVLSLKDFNDFCNIATRVGAFGTLERVVDRHDIRAPNYKFRSALARAYVWRYRNRPDLEIDCFKEARRLSANRNQTVLEAEAREGIRDWTIAYGQREEVLAALVSPDATGNVRKVNLDRITDIHTYDQNESLNISVNIAFSYALRAIEHLELHPRVHVDARMTSLFQRSFPKLDFRPYSSSNVPDLSGHTVMHLRELPLAAYREGIGTDASPRQFLKAAVSSGAASASSEATSHRRLRVGICWRSSSALSSGFRTDASILTRNRIDYDTYLAMGNRFWRKCINLPHFRPLIGHHDLEVISMQFGLADWEVSRLRDHPVYGSIGFRKLDHFSNVDTVASELSTLDAFVTTPNGYAHLAAALGIPTFVLLNDQPPIYWRWIERFPIYPEVRTYYKEPEWLNGNMAARKYDGDWLPTIEAVTHDVRRKLDN